MILKLRRESKGNDLTRKRWRDFESSKESLKLELNGQKDSLSVRGRPE